MKFKTAYSNLKEVTVKAKTTRIHVNQHVIRANHKTGERNPVLTVKSYNSNDYAHEVSILDSNGEEVAKVVYRPDKPLSCGAKVWIETKNKVKMNHGEQ